MFDSMVIIVVILLIVVGVKVFGKVIMFYWIL